MTTITIIIIIKKIKKNRRLQTSVEVQNSCFIQGLYSDHFFGKVWENGRFFSPDMKKLHFGQGL